MTDRELLELAAKAAGLRIIKWTTDNVGEYAITEEVEPTFVEGVEIHRSGAFNPLRFDGDALRLVARLRLDVEWRTDARVHAYRHNGDNGDNPEGFCFRDSIESTRDGNAGAAVRRAIVRAAAEIGR